jgi:hypothetical protein
MSEVGIGAALLFIMAVGWISISALVRFIEHVAGRFASRGEA